MLVAIQPGTSWWYRVVLFDVSTLTPAFCIPYEFPIWNRNGIILVRFVASRSLLLSLCFFFFERMQGYSQASSMYILYLANLQYGVPFPIHSW